MPEYWVELTATAAYLVTADTPEEAEAQAVDDADEALRNDGAQTRKVTLAAPAQAV